MGPSVIRFDDDVTLGNIDAERLSSSLQLRDRPPPEPFNRSRDATHGRAGPGGPGRDPDTELSEPLNGFEVHANTAPVPWFSPPQEHEHAGPVAP